MVCILVMNCIHWCLFPLSQYWTVKIAVWIPSVSTDLNILVSAVCLSVLNCKYCCIWSALGTEFYSLLSAFPLSVQNCTQCFLRSDCRYWIIQKAVCRLTFGTELYTLLCVVCLSLLNWTYCCVLSAFRYWKLHVVERGFSVVTEL